MKIRLAFVALGACTAVLLSSCFWQAATDSASFSIQFTSAQARTIVDDADTLRVYLLAGDELYALGSDSQLYAEQPLGDGYYKSPEIPVGSDYTLIAVVGKKDANGVFWASSYNSTELTISPGVTAQWTMTLIRQTDFNVYALSGESTTGVVDVGGTLYASTRDTLYSVEPSALAATSRGQLTGYTINSLSKGKEGAAPYAAVPWLNTDKGIVPYAAGAFGTDFASGDGKQDVLQSSCFDPTTDADLTFAMAVYQRNGGLGGAVIPASGTPAAADWFDIDLTEFLSGTPILGMAATAKNLYFATSLGAFRIPASLLNSSITPKGVMEAAVFFTASAGNPRILSIALEGKTLFMGTEEGVYRATIDEASAGVFSTTPALVSGTEGKSYAKIRTITHGGGTTLIAFAGDLDIVLYQLSGGTLSPIASNPVVPFYAGLPVDVPGEINDLAWYDNTAEKKVYIVVVGEKGIARRLITDY